MRKLMIMAALMAVSVQSYSQSGTKSPYNQYGFGAVSDQSVGFNKGMNGAGVASRHHNQVNPLNPASYSSIDSLSFIFDAGMSAQITHYKEGNISKNAESGSFDYVVAGFKAFKHVGVSFGILPLTSIDYAYSTSQKVGDASERYTYNAYIGTGGLRHVYLGIGWEPFKGVSLGTNVSYLWGTYSRSVGNVFLKAPMNDPESTSELSSKQDYSINTLTRYYTARLSSYKIDFGAQVEIPFTKKNIVTLAATYSIGHKLGTNAECEVISKNPTTEAADTTSYTLENPYKLPAALSLGLEYKYNNQFRLAVDYTLQKWASTGFPEYRNTETGGEYVLNNDYFKDRHSVKVGFEYCKNENARAFLSRLRYRAGVGFASPYYKISGNDGPKEISVSAGFGIPIVNSWNNRSFINISAQWVKNEAKGMLKENTFRINIGLTFNERWFQKWKFN